MSWCMAMTFLIQASAAAWRAAFVLNLRINPSATRGAPRSWGLCVRLVSRCNPLGFVDGPNVYTYVVQNPWTFFDPEGLNKAKAAQLTRRLGVKTLRNLKFAGGEVTTQVLRDTPSSNVSASRLARIDEKFPNLKVGYSSIFDGVKVKFPEEAILDRVETPFGNGDKTKAWNKYRDKLVGDFCEEEGARMFDSAKENFEMHRSYEDGVFELVDRDVHKAFGHTGGDAWGKAGLLDKSSRLITTTFFAATMGVAGDANASNGDFAIAGLVDGINLIQPTTADIPSLYDSAQSGGAEGFARELGYQMIDGLKMIKPEFSFLPDFRKDEVNDHSQK